MTFVAQVLFETLKSNNRWLLASFLLTSLSRPLSEPWTSGG